MSDVCVADDFEVYDVGVAWQMGVVWTVAVVRWEVVCGRCEAQM